MPPPPLRDYYWLSPNCSHQFYHSMGGGGDGGAATRHLTIAPSTCHEHDKDESCTSFKRTYIDDLKEPFTLPLDVDRPCL